MMHDFTQHRWPTLSQPDIDQLLKIVLHEDLQTVGDLTCLALVPETAQGAARITARIDGILAGVPLVQKILSLVDARLVWENGLADAAEFARGDVIGTIHGPARGLLIAERPVLNFLGRLSGIATLTKRYVDAVQGMNAEIYDTRKTTPGWRQLEKYAVVCGGGRNHRAGLYDAVLIKDNHLALGREGDEPFSPADAVIRAKEFLRERFGEPLPIVEVEVDTLEQFRAVLPAEPDIVLLDNMTVPQLLEAVRIRNLANSGVQLEASGGITLETVRSIAESGVERLSVGALTHSAVSLDFGLDWQPSRR